MYKINLKIIKKLLPLGFIQHLLSFTIRFAGEEEVTWWLFISQREKD